MRKLVVLRTGVIGALVGVGVLVSSHVSSQAPSQSVNEMGDMGAFVEEYAPTESEPQPVVPKTKSKKSSVPTMLSDGKFEELSLSWKRGAVHTVQSGLCDKHDMTFALTSDKDVGFILAKAQAIVESNCEAKMVGTADDVGLNQVRVVACTEAGVSGNRKDPFINASCAAGYRKALCAKYDSCDTLAELYVAYNRGPTGATRVAHPRSTEYVRKIDYVFRLLVKRVANA